MDGLRNAVSFGVPLEQAVMAATSTPAKAIGMEREIGCIRTGARADLLILDEHMELEKVIIGGQIWQ